MFSFLSPQKSQLHRSDFGGMLVVTTLFGRDHREPAQDLGRPGENQRLSLHLRKRDNHLEWADGSVYSFYGALTEADVNATCFRLLDFGGIKLDDAGCTAKHDFLCSYET